MMQRRILTRPLGRIFALMLALASFGAVTFAAPTAVFAQDVESKLQKALASAIEDYDVLEIQDAERRLEDAIKLADKNKFTGPALAKIWAMLGVVRYSATKDESITEDAFVAAVENDPKVEIDPNYATPVLEDVMQRARKRAKPKNTDKPKDNGGDKKVSELTHTTIATADAGKDLTFEAYVPADMPVYRMFVLFRRYEEPDFNRVELKPTSTTRFAATIAGKEIRTSQLDYFIFAEDRGGNIIARVGSDSEPVNVVVLGSADIKRDDPKDIKKDPEPEVPSDRASWMYFSVLGGSDIGFIAGGKATANPERDVNAGIAPAFGHALVDVGVTITNNVHLGLYFRYQFAPSQDFSNIVVDEGGSFFDTKQECLGLGLPGDCLLGVKYKWFFQNNDSIRVYSSIGSGVGRVRNWVRLKQTAPSPLCDGKETLSEGGSDFCYLRDTVRTGWAHFGVGGGLGVPLTSFMDLTTDMYLMLLVPDTSVNLDLSAGFTFRF